VGIRLLFYISLMLLTVGCATERAGNEGAKTVFTRKTVALMRMPTFEKAEMLRLSLLRGESLPLNAEIIPIRQLDQISTVLSKVAAGLGDCEVSRAIPPSETNIGNAYIVLQKGSAAGNSCRPMEKDSRSLYQKIDEKGGELLIGTLMIGVTLLLIALPFILIL
jgi:hypothetical protein